MRQSSDGTYKYLAFGEKLQMLGNASNTIEKLPKHFIFGSSACAFADIFHGILNFIMLCLLRFGYYDFDVCGGVD